MMAAVVSAWINGAIISIGLTAMIGLILRMIPRASLNAATRFGIWWFALLASLALPLLFMPRLNIRIPRPEPLGAISVARLAAEPQSSALPAVPSTAIPLPASVSSPVASSDAIRNSSFHIQLPLRIRTGFWFTLALLVWLTVSVGLIARLIQSYWTLRRRAAAALPTVTTGWSTVPVGFARDIDTPLAIGFRNSAILLPDSYPDNFDEMDLQRICMHEAAHLERRDHYTLLIQRVIEALLPWHPAVHWIARQLDFEREAACDDRVVQATGEYKDYALCLTRVAELGASRATVLAAPTVIGIRSHLSRRVESLLARRNSVQPWLSVPRFLALSILFGGVTFAGGHGLEMIALREPQSSEARIQAIIDDVPSAPPELGADILLKLIENGTIRDAKQKRLLLSDAWDLAPKAKHATEMASPVSVIVESEPGSLGMSLTGLTTAGIQQRVIAQIVALDPKAARELFLRMKPPESVNVSCEDNHYPSYTDYFKALEAVMGTFSAAELQNGDAALFMKNAIRSLGTQADFWRSIQLIDDVKFPERDFTDLLNQWSDLLAADRSGDRQFMIISWMFKFTLRVAETEKERGHSPDRVLQALRTYFVRHASAVRCEDGSWRPLQLGPDLPPTNNEEDARLRFNEELVRLGSGVAPIRPEEIKPSAIKGKALVVSYLSDDPTSKVWEVMGGAKGLRFGPELKGPALTAEQRNTPEWNVRALQYLTQLEKWTNGLGEENRETFVLKAEFYGGLLRLAPEGKLRDTVMKSYVNFLVNSPMKKESPPEWKHWGIDMLMGAREITDKKKLLDDIEAAGDVTISLYTRLARMALPPTNTIP